jgi:hypothetical protein
MKILNVYWGTDAYTFESEPFHSCCKYQATDEMVSYQFDKSLMALSNGKCYWFLISVVDLNPLTGEAVNTNTYRGVSEKAKIILNPCAKKNSIKSKEPQQAIFDDLIPWPAVPTTNPVPEVIGFV